MEKILRSYKIITGCNLDYYKNNKANKITITKTIQASRYSCFIRIWSIIEKFIMDIFKLLVSDKNSAIACLFFL